ncbi:MAG: E2 domain-containing protein [Croceibacterium sp.]
MKEAVVHLLEAAPSWFSVEAVGAKSIIGLAHVPKAPWGADGLRLRIFGDPQPKVCEDVPGTKLPTRCPERHIQDDQTFCLGLHHLQVRSMEQATQWWEQLRQYLICQRAAQQTGIWPPAHALDHGDAGIHHERALAIAKQAGITDEYASARLGEPSWITNPSFHFVDKRGQLINGRALCPRGCLKRGRGRLSPALRIDCSRRKLLGELIDRERRRQVALAEYWKTMIASGQGCCRTMRNCPLRDHEDPARVEEGNL